MEIPSSVGSFIFPPVKIPPRSHWTPSAKLAADEKDWIKLDEIKLDWMKLNKIRLIQIELDQTKMNQIR